MKIAFILIVSLINVVACNNSSNHSCSNNVNVQPQGAAGLTKEQAAIKQLQDYVNKNVHAKDDLWIRLHNIRDEGVLSLTRCLYYSLLELGKFDGKPKELAELILRELRVLNAIKLLLEYIRKINEQGAFIIDPKGCTILGLLHDFNVEGVLSDEELREYKNLWDGNIIDKDQYELAHAVLNNIRTNNQGEDATRLTPGVAALFEEAKEQLRAYGKKNWPTTVDANGVELFKILREIALLGVLTNEDVKYYEEYTRVGSRDPGVIAEDVITYIDGKVHQKRGNLKSTTKYPAVKIPPSRQCLTLKAIERVKDYKRRAVDTPDGDIIFELLSNFVIEDVICQCELEALRLKFYGPFVKEDPFELADQVINTLMGPEYLQCCGPDELDAVLNVTDTKGAAGLKKYEEAIKKLKNYIQKIDKQGAQNYDPKGDKIWKRLKRFARKGVFTQLKLTEYGILQSGKFKGNPKGLAEKVLIDIQFDYAVDQLNQYKEKNWPVVYDSNGDELWNLLRNFKAQGFLHQPIYFRYVVVWEGRIINKDPYALATFVAVDIQERYGNVNGNPIGNANANATVISHGKV